MASLPHEIKVTPERRPVAVVNQDLTERLGFFHKWSENGDTDFALVENTEGTLEYIPVHRLRFLAVDELHPKEIEQIYKGIGVIKYD